MKVAVRSFLIGAGLALLVAVIAIGVVHALQSSSAGAPTATETPALTSDSSVTGAGAATPTQPSKAAFKKACKHVAYKVMNKDADLMVGKRIRITGQVFQIQDAGPGKYAEGYGTLQPRTSMLVSVTNMGYGYWDNNVAVAYEGRLAHVYEKDIVTVWGTCLGQYSYTSVANFDMTVPAIEAKYVSVK